MENEKDLLKKDLSTLEKKEDIEKFIEDTEIMGGHEDIVASAKEKISQLEVKASGIETTPARAAQVENLGGNTEIVAEKTKEVDAEIANVKADAEKQIAEIEIQNLKKEVSREKIVPGAVFDCRMSNGAILEVRVESKIQKTAEAIPREYVRIQATRGDLNTDVTLDQLIEKEPEPEQKEEEKKPE
ncbi:MAG: hypothetical protein WDN09_03750 [bacterium]